MKKHFIILFTCLLVGFSVSASKTTISPLKLKTKLIQNSSSHQKRQKYECMAFTWTPVCQSSPMNSAVCGDNLPENPYDMGLLMMDVMDEIEAILC